LQLKKDKLDVDSERKDSVNQTLHQEEVESLKLKHSEEMEKLNTTHVQQVKILQVERLEVSIYNGKL